MSAPTKTDTLPYMTKLWDGYVDYCRNVSRRLMTINIETASLLWYECVRVRAGSVCDLGSGFTSYVLARYAAEADYPVRIVSVDDDPEWLQRSASFLRRHRMSAHTLETYTQWVEAGETFDVILHDLAGGEIRNRVMWEAADRLNPGGVIIFDDMQGDSHNAEMRGVTEASGWEPIDVKLVTVDETGRYAGLVRT